MNDERLEFMKYIATKAGKIMMDSWGSNVRSWSKEDGSVVTETDLKVSEFVREEFSKRFSDCSLLTEESKDSLDRLTKEHIFIVDELDGSGDFRRKEKDFCFLCAYLEQGAPIIGVVYEPLEERMFFAKKNGGAYVTQSRTTTELRSLNSITWETAKVGHPKNYKGSKYKELYKLLGISEERIVPAGSGGIRMMQVALQQTHMILGYTKNLKEWDIAAGHVILEALGISVTNIQGNALKYNKESPKMEDGVLVVHPDIKTVTLERLAKVYSKLQL